LFAKVNEFAFAFLIVAVTTAPSAGMDAVANSTLEPLPTRV